MSASALPLCEFLVLPVIFTFNFVVSFLKKEPVSIFLFKAKLTILIFKNLPIKCVVKN